MRALDMLCRVGVISQRASTAWTAKFMSTQSTTNNATNYLENDAKFQLNPVQSTSLLVAYWRDLETRQQLHERPPLIQDPTAQILVDALSTPSQRQSYETSAIRPYGLECLAVRTRAFDDWLLSPPDRNEGRQSINLGAGMCSRPYRMDGLNHDRWLEVDSDLQLLSVKRSVLEAAGYQPKLPVVDVSIDLSCPVTCLATELRAKGFSDLPTDWIAEGLFAYLKPSQHSKLLQETAAISLPGSRMALTVAEPAFSEFWNSLGASIPYEDLVPVGEVVEKAESFGWTVVQHIRPEDWSSLYPGRGESLFGYNVLFLTKK